MHMLHNRFLRTSLPKAEFERSHRLTIASRLGFGLANRCHCLGEIVSLRVEYRIRTY